MGQLTFFLGLQIFQIGRGIFIYQSKYVKVLIQKFRMENVKSISTPICPSCNLDLDLNSKNVDETNYRGRIKSFLYLIVSRPDIMLSVCKCARFQATLKESHLTTVKRITHYLMGTISYGLWYEKSSIFNLRGFLDADYVGDKVDRKNTSDSCQFLGDSLISWNSKK